MMGEAMKSSVKIAVILPSRGLMFSQTADEILKNLKGIDHKFYFSHGKPIPDCFEDPTKEAQRDFRNTHFWFVEDDMVLPPNTLKKMLDKDAAVVTADYPVSKEGRGSVFKVGKEVIFCGTGCLLVKREVIDEMKAPYFRTDMKWNIKNYGDFLKMTRSKTSDLDGYGLHDVNFCMNLQRLEIPIHVIAPKLGQRKLINLGKAGTNDGAHNIEVWSKVVPNHLLNQVKKWPVELKGNLVSVMTKDGEIGTTKEHAKKLVKAGLGTIPPKRKIVIDWNVE
jgi:hypothetical protein